MEDWAYAASWENNLTSIQPIKQCNPKSYGGYPLNRTVYDDVSVKSLIYIVEAGFDKKPEESSLGTDDNLFNIGMHIYII